jgi:TrwC relaxase
MLRHHVQYDADAAKRYYRVDDYYIEGEALANAPGGEAARRLGVWGSNDKTHFERLCDNLHPLTYTALTQRTNDARIAGIDLTFDGPKGFVVLEAFTGDARLRRALNDAVEETMRELHAAARVRKGGADYNRTTFNPVWYRAPHDTTRPVDGRHIGQNLSKAAIEQVRSPAHQTEYTCSIFGFPAVGSLARASLWGCSRQRGQGHEEGELSLEAADEPVIGGDELAALALGQGDVDAIVDADPHGGGDGVGAGQQRQRRMELRQGGQQVGQQASSLGRGDAALALGPR